jgi:hypothetical protein
LLILNNHLKIVLGRRRILLRAPALCFCISMTADLARQEPAIERRLAELGTAWIALELVYGP